MFSYFVSFIVLMSIWINLSQVYNHLLLLVFLKIAYSFPSYEQFNSIIMSINKICMPYIHYPTFIFQTSSSESLHF